MKEIELLEKLVGVQEMHIELMQDYNNLKLSFEAYKEIKIEKSTTYKTKSSNKPKKLKNSKGKIPN